MIKIKIFSQKIIFKNYLIILYKFCGVKNKNTKLIKNKLN